jgi:hypothetical protein
MKSAFPAKGGISDHLPRYGFGRKPPLRRRIKNVYNKALRNYFAAANQLADSRFPAFGLFNGRFINTRPNSDLSAADNGRTNRNRSGDDGRF